MPTFSKAVKFSVGSKAHVLLRGEAIAIKRFRPQVTLAGQDRGTTVPHCHTETAARLDETAGRRRKPYPLKRARERAARPAGFRRLQINLRVETDGGDEGAEEGLGLRVAARLQEGPPVLRAWDHLTLQAAVTQEIRQPHLGVSHILADPHLVGDGDAAGGLTHVECQQGRGQSQESRKEEQSHGSRNPRVHKMESCGLV